MSAQAGQIKTHVSDLVATVRGGGNSGTVEKVAAGARPKDGMPARVRTTGHAVVKTEITPRVKEVSPEKLIPLENDFSDF